MRSLLFVPASRYDRFSRAVGSGADSIALDLEDALPYDQKEMGQDNVLKFHKEGGKFWVRINKPGSEHFYQDIALLSGIKGDLLGVIVPKVRDKGDLEKLSGIKLIAMIESSQGVLNIKSIASYKNVFALSFGALDLALSLGTKGGEGEDFILNQIRSEIVINSSINKLHPPIEGVCPSTDDLSFLHMRANFARSMGFGGMMCIHPRQVEEINRVFGYSEEEVEWANKVYNGAIKHNYGAFILDGKMIDLPLINKAKRILDDTCSKSSSVRGRI